jgi:hypothetical protein
MSQRTQQEITVDYQKHVMKAGSIQYQIHALQKDLDLVNDQLRDLNVEYLARQRFDEENKAKEQPAPTEEVKNG